MSLGSEQWRRPQKEIPKNAEIDRFEKLAKSCDIDSALRVSMCVEGGGESKIVGDRNVNEWSDDYKNDYSYSNSLGFRGPEPTANTELLAFGCSQTYGVGVPESGTWVSLLANRLGYTYANYAWSGWGTQAFVDALRFHIERYGTPKAVCILMPDFGRIETVDDGKNIIVEGREKSTTRGAGPASIRSLPFDRPLVQYSKSPHQLEDILIPEYYIYRFNNELLSLIDICKYNNIDFYWTSWDVYVLNFYKTMSEHQTLDLLTDQFIYMDTELANGNYYHNEDKYSGCHQYLLEPYKEYFYCGSDKDSHNGVHVNAHIADSFYDRLKGKSNV